MQNSREPMHNSMQYRPLTPAGLDMAMASGSQPGPRFLGGSGDFLGGPHGGHGLPRRADQDGPNPSFHRHPQGPFSDPFLSSRGPPRPDRMAPNGSFDRLGGAEGGLRDPMPREGLAPPLGPGGFYTVESLDAAIGPPMEPRFQRRLDGPPGPWAPDKDMPFMEQGMNREPPVMARALHREPLFDGRLPEMEPHSRFPPAHAGPPFMPRPGERDPAFMDHSLPREAPFIPGMPEDQAHMADRARRLDAQYMRAEREPPLGMRNMPGEMAPPVDRGLQGNSMLAPRPPMPREPPFGQPVPEKGPHFGGHPAQREGPFPLPGAGMEGNLAGHPGGSIPPHIRGRDVHPADRTAQTNPFQAAIGAMGQSEQHRELAAFERSNEKEAHGNERRRDSLFSEAAGGREPLFGDRGGAKNKDLLHPDWRGNESHVAEQAGHRDASFSSRMREEELRVSGRTMGMEPRSFERGREKEPLSAEQITLREPYASGRAPERDTGFSLQGPVREPLYSDRKLEADPRSAERGRERQTGFTDPVSEWSAEKESLWAGGGRGGTHQHVSEHIAERGYTVDDRGQERESLHFGRAALPDEGGHSKHGWTDRHDRSAEKDILLHASRERERSPQPRSSEYRGHERATYEKGADRDARTYLQRQEALRSPERMRGDEQYGRYSSAQDGRSGGDPLGWSKPMKREAGSKDFQQDGAYSRLDDAYGRRSDSALVSERAHVARSERDWRLESKPDDRLADRYADKHYLDYGDAGRSRSHRDAHSDRARGYDPRALERGRQREDDDILARSQGRDQLERSAYRSGRAEDPPRRDVAGSRALLAPKDTHRYEPGRGVERGLERGLEHRDRAAEVKLSEGKRAEKELGTRDSSRGKERVAILTKPVGSGEKSGAADGAAGGGQEGKRPAADEQKGPERGAWSGQVETRRSGEKEVDRSRKPGGGFKNGAKGASLGDVLAAMEKDQKWASLGPPMMLGKCKVCMVECPSFDVLRAHMAGKKHKLMLEEKAKEEKAREEEKGAGKRKAKEAEEKPDAKKAKMEEGQGAGSAEKGHATGAGSAGKASTGATAGKAKTSGPAVVILKTGAKRDGTGENGGKKEATGQAKSAATAGKAKTEGQLEKKPAVPKATVKIKDTPKPKATGLLVISRANDDEEVDIDMDSDNEGAAGKEGPPAQQTAQTVATGILNADSNGSLADVSKKTDAGGMGEGSDLEIALQRLQAVGTTADLELMPSGTQGGALAKDEGPKAVAATEEEVQEEQDLEEELGGDQVGEAGEGARGKPIEGKVGKKVETAGRTLNPQGLGPASSAAGDSLPERVGGFYVCKLCGVACNSAIMWFSHVGGKKHQLNLQGATAGELSQREGQAGGPAAGASVEEGKNKQGKREGGGEKQEANQQGGAGEGANGGSTGGGLVSSRGARGGRGWAAGQTVRGRGFRGGPRGGFRGRAGPGGRAGLRDDRDWDGNMPSGHDPGPELGGGPALPGPGLWVPGSGPHPEIFVSMLDPAEMQMRAGKSVDGFSDGHGRGEGLARGAGRGGGFRGRGRGGRGFRGL